MRASPSAAPEPDPANVHTGLSDEQVEARRQQCGPNEVLEKKPHAVLAFLSKFWGLSAWMLEAIAALSWTLHRYADLAVPAGLTVASQLAARIGGGAMAVIEPSTTHYYQPLWTLVGGGIFPKEESARDEADFIPEGVTWLEPAW